MQCGLVYHNLHRESNHSQVHFFLNSSTSSIYQGPSKSPRRSRRLVKELRRPPLTWECLGRVWFSALRLLNLEGSSGDGSSDWVPASHVGGLDGVPSFSTGSAMATVGIRGVTVIGGALFLPPPQITNKFFLSSWKIHTMKKNYAWISKVSCTSTSWSFNSIFLETFLMSPVCLWFFPPYLFSFHFVPNILLFTSGYREARLKASIYFLTSKVKDV